MCCAAIVIVITMFNIVNNRNPITFWASSAKEAEGCEFQGLQTLMIPLFLWRKAIFNYSSLIFPASRCFAHVTLTSSCCSWCPYTRTHATSRNLEDNASVLRGLCKVPRRKKGEEPGQRGKNGSFGVPQEQSGKLRGLFGVRTGLRGVCHGRWELSYWNSHAQNNPKNTLLQTGALQRVAAF